MRWLLWLAGVVAFALSLLLFLPAPWLVAQVTERYPALAAGAVDGTLYRGEVGTLSWRGQPLGRLDWRLRPWALPGGKLSANAELDGAAHRLRGLVDLGLDADLKVRQLEGELPLALAAALWSPAPLALPLTGRIGVDLDEVVIDANDGRLLAVSGDLRLEDTALRTELAPGGGIELGDFAATLATAAAGVNATATDQGGPLALQARLTIAADGRYRLDGTLANRADDPALELLLAPLGPAGDDGQRPFQLAGRLW